MKSILALILILILLPGCFNGNFSAEGTVISIERGKDGYNAIIKTITGKNIHFTASQVDMGISYSKVEIGDKVKVYGDSSNYAGEIHIHAEKIDQ
jgi:hypothetical protein